MGKSRYAKLWAGLTTFGVALLLYFLLTPVVVIWFDKQTNDPSLAGVWGNAPFAASGSSRGFGKPCAELAYHVKPYHAYLRAVGRWINGDDVMGPWEEFRAWKNLFESMDV